MGLVEKIKHFFSEAKKFDTFFCLTAISFGFLDKQALTFLKKQSFPYVCFQSLAEAFMKALLAETLCFITWKALLYMENVNTRNRWVVLSCLTAIHVIWIYFMNLCFTCMLSKLETAITLLEFFVLLTIVTFIARGFVNVLKSICSPSNDVEISHKEPSIPPNPIQNSIPPMFNEPTSNEPMSMDPESFAPKNTESTSLQPTQELLLNNAMFDPSINSNNMQMDNSSPGESASNPEKAPLTNGMPACKHRTTLRSPVNTLRSKDTPTMTNDSCKIIPLSPPYEGPSGTDDEWQTLESKTRSGCVFRKIKVHKNSSSITRM